MPLSTTIRDLLKTLYDEAENATDKQANRRVIIGGKEYKVHASLSDWPDRAMIRFVRKS